MREEESALPWSTAADLAGTSGTFTVTERFVEFLPAENDAGRLVILVPSIRRVGLSSDDALLISANDAVFEFRFKEEDEENLAFVLVSALVQGLLAPEPADGSQSAP